MVLCVLAALGLGVLAVFSAKYRPLAREAFDCVARKATLRPCQSGLDERLRSQIVAKVLDRSPAAARTLNKYFEAFSWIILALTLISTFFFVQGLYNYYAYGNCNGPNSTAFCVYDALNPSSFADALGLGSLFNTCAGRSSQPFGIIANGVGQAIGNGSVKVVEFGCFTCPSTKQALPLVTHLVSTGQITLEFRTLPIKAHPFSHQSAQAAECATEQGKFWEYFQLLFSHRSNEYSMENFTAWAGGLGMNSAQFSDCLSSGRTNAIVERDIAVANAAGVCATPTFFIGNVSLVGPAAFAKYFGLNASEITETCPLPREIV